MIDKNILAHLILLPLILNKIDNHNDNDLNIILENTIEKNPDTKKYLAVISVMFPNFNNKWKLIFMPQRYSCNDLIFWIVFDSSFGMLLP